MNKIKRKLIIALTMMLLLTGCETNMTSSNKEYVATLFNTGIAINSSAIANLAWCDGVSEIWQYGIDKGLSVNKTMEIIQETANKRDLIKKFNDNKKEIDALMNELNNPPEEYKEVYNKLLELYGQYTKLYKLSTSPNGSLISYNQSVEEVQSEVSRLYNELKVLAPKDIIDKINN